MRNLNKVILAAFLTSLSAFSLADSTTSVESNATIPAEHLTQLCIAALKSEQAYFDTARELEISKEARDRLVCNDMNVDDFTANYRLIGENSVATIQ